MFPPLFSHPFTILSIVPFFAPHSFVHMYTVLPDLCTLLLRYRIELIRFSFYVLFSKRLDSNSFYISCICSVFLRSFAANANRTHDSILRDVMFCRSRLIDWLFTLFGSLLRVLLAWLLLFSKRLYLCDGCTRIDNNDWTNKKIVKWLCIEQTWVTVDFWSDNNNAFWMFFGEYNTCFCVAFVQLEMYFHVLVSAPLPSISIHFDTLDFRYNVCLVRIFPHFLVFSLSPSTCLQIFFFRACIWKEKHDKHDHRHR